MSARGARSRKVQLKDVEKKEKKVGKNKATDPSDAFADWRMTPTVDNPRRGVSRSLTVSSRATSRSSGTNDSNNRPRLATVYSSTSSDVKAAQSSGGGSASVSDVSTTGKEKTRFQANGKETKAPRGRGGGVPIKRTVAPSPAPPHFRAESSASHPSSNQKTWLNFKVWNGTKDAMRPYGGFDFDEDMSNGSVLIYFKEEQVDDEQPLPSIRAELDILENSGSTWLKETLLYSRVDDDDELDWNLPTLPVASSPQSYHQYDDQIRHRRMLGPTSPGGRSPPPFDIEQSYDGISTRAASRLDQFSETGRSRQSRLDSLSTRPPAGGATHKIWFTAPEHIKTAQAQRLHHVAIRNFLAMLHGKPIVGADLFDMLSTLQPQIEDMYKFDDHTSRLTARARSVQMITNYLGQHGIDDVRSSIKSAMCLLTWSEQESIKWRQGYLENFVHLAGVMIPELEEVPEFKRMSVVTRRNLGIAAKTLQLRKMEAEEKLTNFDFIDLWEDAAKAAASPVFQSYQAFRLFLVNHYARNYGSWPPTNKTWLSRKVVLALQNDFGSLYDYLVNRDVVWNPREERASRKWEMAHRKNDNFKADCPELGITDVLVRFDAKFGYAHIPHPYPLLPRDIPRTTKEKEKKSLFSSLKKDKSKDVTKDAKAHLQLSILFSDATNIEKLDVNFNGSTLIDKFEQFEMTTDLKNVTPREARLGRWVLLYGILQVLSTLSVDVPGLKHTDGVRYFLCTDLKRCPEWVTNGQTEHLEARQQRSWCWQRSWDPAPTQTAPVELEATSFNEPAQQQHTASSNTNLHVHESVHPDRHNIDTSPNDFNPPPPLDLTSNLDGATLMQNDIRRINEKITQLSLPAAARQTITQEYERRRENEKAIHSDLYDWKPRFDSLPEPPHPTPASLARQPHRLENPNMRSENMDFAPPSSDFDFIQPLPRPTRGTISADLGGYPFSAGGNGDGGRTEMQWPVPPGYSEATERGHGGHRESGIGYSVTGESGFGMGRNAWREEAESRSPRRMHERGGWM
ncbi:hypothetical protein DE146DRAFT_425807 [Phaeosphaeria sp. MPI-PUGE-AT-0046c]|nr:hypothetical protein DE146DRAFT_425807 [Phaeosphaeria sp. MPI-PUGE-AT-0046c]